MDKQSFSKRILLGITGEVSSDWKAKLDEINEMKISEIAVFLERFNKRERENFYPFLLKSSIKKVPFVHLTADTTKEEIKFFINKFQTRYFNIHESDFDDLDKWKGFWDKLYLELDYSDQVAKEVKVERIGGFCVDLSHLKASLARGGEEAYYIFLRKNKGKFSCNHLNGYSPGLMTDIHTISSLRDFDYLTSLPKYVFGKAIALEVMNSIKEQLKFKEYLSRLLDDYFAAIK
ncbi:MAG: hypothetical protein Q8N16_02090 [bacterium]|nr:hypothetical protein [bacterium]